MYDSPSADKFAAPPDSSAPRQQRSRATAVALVVLPLAIMIASLWLESNSARGWLAIACALTLFALGVVEYAVQRKHAAQIGGADPYTPPTRLTR